MDPLVLITSILSIAAIIIAAVSRTPSTARDDTAAARALEELQLQRDELSKLRFDLTRDRDELRQEVGKHEQAIVRLGKDVKDALVEIKTESSKLSLMHSQPRRI